MRTTTRMGLISWDQPSDFYNYAQLAGNWQILDFHDHSPGKGVPVSAGGIAPGAVLSQNIAAGVVGSQHFSSTLVSDLGLNGGGQTGQGYVNIAASQTYSGTSFSLLSTPDEISGITVATGGLVFVAYSATWSSSVADAGSAAIFLGSNQVKINSSTGTAPAVQAATGTGAGIGTSLSTGATGLVSGAQTSNYTGDITTGQIIGSNTGADQLGMTPIFVAAGTYNVSIQFKVSSGSVTVSNRQLWVWTRNFS